MSYADALQAIPLQTEPPSTVKMNIEGIFEFAPVDLHVEDGEGILFPLDAEGVHRTIVTGTCDNDVANYQDVGPFSRRRMNDTSSRTFSSVLGVPGANHNYFNVNWPLFDRGVLNTNCPAGQDYQWQEEWTIEQIALTSGSQRQKDIGIITLSAFFRGFVGNFENRGAFQNVFDAQYHPPSQLTALTNPVRESLWHQSTEIFETTSATATPDVAWVHFVEGVDGASTVGMERELTRVEWEASADEQFFETDLFGNGRTLDDAWILSFSVARYQEDAAALAPEVLDFGVSLAFADGSYSAPVQVVDYVSLVNGVNEISTCAAQGGTETSPGVCTGTEGDTWLRQERFLLLLEVPIEIRDFDIADGVEDESVFDSPATGLRFHLPAETSGKIAIDRMHVLRKFPLLGGANAALTTGTTSRGGEIDLSEGTVVTIYEHIE